MPVKRARRQEILDAAATVIASSGYVGTSLKDIADACGIQAGSLYHHFASKEAIAVELVARFTAEMEQVADAALQSTAAEGAAPPRARIIAFCTAIAECAFAHRAALQLTSYEPPTGASTEFVDLVRSRPASVMAVMTAILRDASDGGVLNSDVDAELFATELCEMTRHVGLGIFYRGANAREVAAVLCHLVLDGGPTRPVEDRQLDRSAARRAADAAIRAWAARDEVNPEDRTTALLAVARTEFARRGYEATTVRDIAAAARMRSGNVYRFIESKDAMLASIMSSYHTRLSDGYRAVIASDSTAVELLDALTWLNINILKSFPEEFAIQRAWMRAIPPAASDLSVHQRERAGQIRQIVAEGLRRGELRSGWPGCGEPSVDVLAMCYRDLVWPSALVQLAGAERALEHCRSTLVRGAATVSQSRRAASAGGARRP